MSSNDKSTDISIAMIKFVVGMEEIKKAVSCFVVLPEWFPPVYNGGVRCDVATGSCSCGAWHKNGEERDVRY